MSGMILLSDYQCCDAFGELASQEEYCPTLHINGEGRWAFSADDIVVRFCPFCGTPVPEPWFDQRAIDMTNAALLARPSYDAPGKHFIYLDRETTNDVLSYAPRDNPKRDTPDGRWSCYRVYFRDKWRWRDETSLYGDVRKLTTVHNPMRGPNYGARLTDDTLWVITRISPEDEI